MQSVRIRASSWGRLFDCAFSWEGTQILGIRSPGGPRSVLGQSIHAGTAAFDAAKIKGQPISVYDAAGVLVDTLQDKGAEVSWNGSDINKNDAEKIGIKLLNKYCLDISPQYEFLAVELDTKPLLIKVGGVIIELTGTLDRSRLVRHDAAVCISDLKSGRAAVSKGVAVTKGHGAQLGTYEILYEHTTGERITAPGEIIGMQTTRDAPIAMGKVVGAKQMMLGTEEHKGLIQIGAEMIKSGLFPPNPQSKICDPRYCARWSRCPYHL